MFGIGVRWRRFWYLIIRFDASNNNLLHSINLLYIDRIYKYLIFFTYIYYIYVNILLSLCIYYRECLNKNFEFVDPVDIGMMTPPRQLPFCNSSRSSSVNSTVNTPLFYEDTSASNNDPYSSTPFVQQRNKRKRDVQVCFSGEDGTESTIFWTLTLYPSVTSP